MSRGRLALLALLLSLLALGAFQASLAAFGSLTENGGNVVSTASDFKPPQVTAVVIGKTSGGATGFVKKSGTYYVYANVAADTGKPASGIATVTANATTLTASAEAASLTAGTYSAGGTAFGWRSSALTAGPSLSEGAKVVSVTATDKAGNQFTQNGSATVDNTPPQAGDVQTANGAATVGKAEQNDTLTLTFSEPVEPGSIVSGWDGTAMNVVVRLYNNSLLEILGGNDWLEIRSTSGTVLPLGKVSLGRNDYALGLLGGTIDYGNAAAWSKMTLTGSTLTVVLGTYTSGGNALLEGVAGTASGNGNALWAPVATPYDRAENPMSTTSVTGSGAPHKEF